MVEILKDLDDDVVIPVLVRLRVPSFLVRYSLQKKSRKDRFTSIHSLVPLCWPDIKEEDLVDYIIPVENTM